MSNASPAGDRIHQVEIEDVKAAGREAARQGTSIEENPYPPTTHRWAFWRAGWISYRQEDGRTKRYSLEQLNRLRFLGANRDAVLSALRAYWGEEDYLPAWRQQAEVTMFSRALHAAVQSVLKDDAPAPEPAPSGNILMEVGLLVDLIKAMETAGEWERAAKLREIMV